MARPKLTKPLFKLGRKGDSPNWYIQWTWEGVSHCKSAHTADETAARQYLIDIEKKWNQAPVQEELTINQVLDIYFKYKEGEYSVRGENVDHWMSNFRKLKAEVDHNKLKRPGTPPSIRDYFGYMKVSQLERQMGRDYVQLLKKAAKSNATIAKRLSVLNSALSHCEDEKKISKPTIMQLPPPPPPKNRIVTPEQIFHFLRMCADAPHVETFSIIVLHTLSRKGAVLGLRWKEVDFDTRMIEFNPPGRIITKKKRIRTLMNDILLAQLQKAYSMRKTDYVIEWEGSSIKEIGKAFRFYAHKAGMPWLSPHILRHTGASMLAASGVSMEKIAELMSDTVETTRKHYIKYSPEYLKEATDKLNEIYGKKG